MSEMQLEIIELLVNLRGWNFDIQNYRLCKKEAEVIYKMAEMLSESTNDGE